MARKKIKSNKNTPKKFVKGILKGHLREAQSQIKDDFPVVLRLDCDQLSQVSINVMKTGNEKIFCQKNVPINILRHYHRQESSSTKS